jgi:hypothetical protein
LEKFELKHLTNRGTVTGHGGPSGCETSRLPHFLYTVGSQLAVRLSALRAGRPLPLGRFLVLIFVRDWADHRAIVRLEGLGQFKIIHLIGTRTRNLPAYSIVREIWDSGRNMTLFWEVTPYLIEVWWCSRGRWWLQLQERRWRQNVPPKRGRLTTWRHVQFLSFKQFEFLGRVVKHSRNGAAVIKAWGPLCSI